MPTREDVIHDILAKKELAGIEHAFVEAILEKELRRDAKLAKQVDTLSVRSAAYKDLVKSVRAVLRRNVTLYGQGDARERDVLLAELRQSGNAAKREEIIQHLLATHNSTKERLPHYDQVYAGIFKRVGKPASVLDIGCGLNPISYPDRGASYVGVDIDRQLCTTVQQYFDIVSMDGACKVLDAKGMEQISTLPKSDVAFVFKLLELLEKKLGHKISEKLIKALPAKHIIVSFPTVTSSGAPMRAPHRAWIEMMLRRIGYSYETFTIPNEIFYVITKGR
jgi:16S rRNA (guanine(1405)-N(7))-methyltransferase